MSTPVAPGTIMMWGGYSTNIPEGWLLCDGSLVSQTQYAALFKAVGFSFGLINSTSEFYLPDLRGRFVRGVDDGAGRDPDVNTRTDMQNSALLSTTAGSIQADAFQNHTHPYNTFPDGRGNIASGGYWQNGQGETGVVDETSTYRVSTETRPINAYLYFIIACS